jgi:hypothetical protein
MKTRIKRLRAFTYRNIGTRLTTRIMVQIFGEWTLQDCIPERILTIQTANTGSITTQETFHLTD